MLQLVSYKLSKRTVRNDSACVDINADMVIIVAGENVGAGIDSWLEETL